MKYRFMRVIVMFDLPVESSKEKRDYREFRRYLIKSGFIMMQESIYTKLALNTTNVKTIIKNLKKNKPEQGIVQVLTITERQFANMQLIVGSVKGDVVNTDERLIIL